ncbi:phosphatase 1 regulatory subunit 15A [Danaus plexippus plexippus]|uniref:Phosphatase 1 regulatory subunit 15A n=1 Tax=Danaus plexippus plexippus TaxID=278856 RepID=A0A212FG81_DANPL|nr:phosphatase 1 regulatory subunit 15A [Danaus plexippus plexippus]
MNNFCGERNRRRFLDFGVFPTFQYPISNYSTSSQTKTEMKNTFEDNFFANNLHLIQDPLKKNLANTVLTGEDKKTNMGKTKVTVTKEEEIPQKDYYSFHSGITGVLTGILNFMGLSQTRSTSSKHHETDYNDRQMASGNWHYPKCEVQNKNERDRNTNMDIEVCRLTSEHCDNKNNCTNLFSEFQPSVARESFIPGDSEDIDIGLFNESCIEYFCPNTYQEQELCETAAQGVKTEILNICVDIGDTQAYRKTELNESMEIEKPLPTNGLEIIGKTREAASSCEDKMSKLKALLKCRQNKNYESSLPSHDKTKPVDIPSKYSETVQDTLFANEIASSNLTNSFNEVSGKFCSSSVDSEDSFQIVFTDSPQNFERRRISSDCESEDSFIVFEETPENCYTNNDVFGDESSDSDSVVEESMCIAQLSPNLSKTFSDLTDTSLYSEDVVDFAEKCDNEDDVHQPFTGLLINETRKQEKLRQPKKRVRFSSQPPKVHVMRVWAFAARQARAGHWERHALDRERFKRRIADVEMAISWVLKPQHRSRIVFQRFMPWWNAERRRELAEKKREEDTRREAEEVEKMAIRRQNDENCNEVETESDLMNNESKQSDDSDGIRGKDNDESAARVVHIAETKRPGNNLTIVDT